MRKYLQFIASNKAILSLGFLAVFWGNWGQSFFISWFGASLQESLSLSAGEYGLAYSLATLASSICLVYLGGLLDRVDLRKYIFATVCGLILAFFSMSYVSGWYSLIIAFFFLRLCGQGILPHTGQTITVKYFGPDRGKALGLVSTGISIGEISLPIFAVWLIATYGWQGSWRIIAYITIIVFIPILLLLFRRLKNNQDIDSSGLIAEYKEPKVDSVSSATKIEYDRADVLKESRFWFIIPSVLLPPFAVTGIFIHQASLLAEKDWSAALFASSFIIYGIINWLTAILIGPVVDKFSGRRLISFYLLPLSIGSLILAYYNQSLTVMVFMILLGISQGIGTPIVGSLWAELYGTAKMGAIRSFLTALMVFSSSLSPVIFGYLLDKGWSFSSILVSTTMAAMLTMFMAWYGARENYYSKNNKNKN